MMVTLNQSQKIILFLGVSLALVGCASFDTHSDFDPQITFSDYQYFTWAEDRQWVQARNVGDHIISALNLQRIENAIVNELMSKGFQKADRREQADFLIAFTVGVRDKLDIDRYPVAYQERWVRHWPYYWDSVTVHSYAEGTLAIDVYDRVSGRPAWHGIASKRITNADTEHATESISAAVNAILRKFPPSKQ
ncbi:DUF4136 domain-containing protein [Congregibacter variabilis]|uniref:DUF4136 domain-containing protein n=1 Tax=Congregibacter variabilis TaxID=3081200 RepID=A0ABZ0I562_9GAMM|nr:DUF4136 domain-containing protein [Congregibacter sp. IMCC43200]